MKRKVPAYWICMILFCLLGMLIGLFPGYRFSAGICFGIAALIGLFRLLIWLGSTHPKLSKVLRSILTIGLCCVILAAAVTGIIILRVSAGEAGAECGHLIVLGAGVNGTVPSLSLRERINAAYDYLSAHPDAIAVVSGGKGNGEQITEALCMYNELTKMGIDGSRVWMEDQATSTFENLKFSMALIEEKTGSRPDSIGIVSSEYHLFRAGLFAAAQDVDSLGIPATTTWPHLRVNYFIREIIAVWHYIVFGG